MVQMELIGARMQESPCVLVEIVGLDRCQKIDVGRHTYARWHQAPAAAIASALCGEVASTGTSTAPARRADVGVSPGEAPVAHGFGWACKVIRREGSALRSAASTPSKRASV